MAKIYSINGGNKRYRNKRSGTDIYTLHTDKHRLLSMQEWRH